MYDALLDHDLDEDSPAADIELGGKSIDDESDDDEDLSINNLSDDKAEEPASLDIESDLPDSESWSDDPVRMYLTQMGEIPLLTRQQEINLARRIETTRAAFRRRLLACDYVIRAAFKVLSRVHRGELPFDRTVQVSVTDRLEKEQILGRLPHNLATLEQLLERNAADYATATNKSVKAAQRRAAWERR